MGFFTLLPKRQAAVRGLYVCPCHFGSTNARLAISRKLSQDEINKLRLNLQSLHTNNNNSGANKNHRNKRLSLCQNRSNSLPIGSQRKVSKQRFLLVSINQPLPELRTLCCTFDRIWSVSLLGYPSNRIIMASEDTPENGSDLKSGPFSVLYKSVQGNSQVLINLRNNHKLLGRVKAYDRHMNL